MKRYFKIARPVHILGLVLTGIILVAALFAPGIAPHHYADQRLQNALLPPVWAEGGSSTYPLGTDHMGRDLLSRIIYGSRVSLGVATAAVLVAGTVGTTLGLVSGFFGGWVDNLVMRMVDLQLSFPPVLLTVAILTVVGHALIYVVLVLGLISWVQYARVARGSTLAYKEKEFVEAARSLGSSSFAIMIRHILPNVLPELVVVATISVSAMMLAEASLSFLGMGIRPPTPAWGSMMSEGRAYFSIAWWYAVFPGLSILVTVLSVNLVGDGLLRMRGR